MIRTFSATTEIFLTNLELVKQRASKDSTQLSSGHAVTEASDSPADVVSLLRVSNEMAQLGQMTENLTRLKTEVDSGESALENAVSLLQDANVLAAQALGVGQTSATMQALAVQVQNLQQQMVGLSQTNAAGHYIFSGDDDLQPQYTMTPGPRRRSIRSPACIRISRHRPHSRSPTLWAAVSRRPARRRTSSTSATPAMYLRRITYLRPCSSSTRA